MPIYEYKCSKCGVIEVTQSITDPPLDRCPKCRRKVKRLISLNNFHLKGSGWYSTGYSHKSGGNGGDGKALKEKEKDKEKPKPEKSEKTTESKPAESPKSKTEDSGQ